MICRKCDTESAQIAVDYLRRGKVVVLPTDTVYGFSGIVDGRHYSFHTFEKICAIKSRPEGKNFIQLIARPEDIKKYTRDVIPESLLAKWPGPLSIIVHTFADDGNFELAERIDTLRIIAGKKNLSVPMMSDMIILMLGDDYTKYDYILDDIR